MDPLALLTRTDKWFLGGGKGAIYAPPFPRFLESIGFWDEVYLADIRIPRLFTVLFLNRSGKPIRLRTELESWRPDRIVFRHECPTFRMRETRCVTERNAWVTQLELLEGDSPARTFVWTLHDLRSDTEGSPWQSLGNIEPDSDSMRLRWDTAWPAELEPDRTGIDVERLEGKGAMLPALGVYLQVGANRTRRSFTVNLAQRHDDAPRYELSLLPEKFRDGVLSGDFKFRVGTEAEGLLHTLQHFEWDGATPLVVAAGTGLTPAAASESFSEAMVEGVVARSEAAWRSYFAGVPPFQSEDPFLTHAYWYRWYGLRLNTVDIPDLPIQGKPGETFGPYVTEGVGFFRNFVTYSAQAHLRDVAWMDDPSLAIGILDNLCRVQREDGSFPGHNYSCRPARDFYHADFATGLRRLHARHPGAVTREHLQAMRHYADYFLRHRTLSKDPASPTLYDVFDQNETGQEYMSRYAFASENADKWASFRVSGVDATVYAVLLFELLADFRAAGSPYTAFALGAREGLKRYSFDPDARFYCDVRPDGGAPYGTRSPARPATGLYVGLLGLHEPFEPWMLNPDEFWLPAGFPATAASDPTFRAEGEWKDRRLNCPWNGRSWPMANSHLVEALRTVAKKTGDPLLLKKAEEARDKAIRLMFHHQDPTRPNAYEHYNPTTGLPALYRGYDDYMHSWIVDLILGA